MENTKVYLEIMTTNFDLMRRFEIFCNELDLSANEAFEIAVDRLLQDFGEMIHLWTCRKAIVKRKYTKPDKGNIF